MDALNEYLVKNQLQLKTDGINKTYLCNICKKILCKPKVGKCGCNYCSLCLSANYNENNECPSCKKYLNFEIDVTFDTRIENKILQLDVTCPNTFCNGKFIINQLVAHLQTCYNKGTKCLFHMYGCSASVNTDTAMHEHLTRDLRYHLDLLLKNISKNDNRKDEKINLMDREFNDKMNQIELKLNENKNKANQMDGKVNHKVNRIDQEVTETKNKVNQGKLEYTYKISKLYRNFEQLKESMDDKFLKCEMESRMELDKLKEEMKVEADSKLEKFKGEMNKINEEKSVEIFKSQKKLNKTKMVEKYETESQLDLDKMSTDMKIETEFKLLKVEMNKIIKEKDAEILKLREKLNEKTYIAEVGEYFVVGEGQYKVTFKDMDQKKMNKNYTSEKFTLDNYKFLIEMRCTRFHFIRFAVHSVKDNKDLLKWPLVNKLNLTLLRKDGRVYTNHKFSYASSPEEWKYCYNGGYDLADSWIAVYDGLMVNNNEVSLILTMGK